MNIVHSPTCHEMLVQNQQKQNQEEEDPHKLLKLYALDLMKPQLDIMYSLFAQTNKKQQQEGSIQDIQKEIVNSTLSHLAIRFFPSHFFISFLISLYFIT